MFGWRGQSPQKDPRTAKRGRTFPRPAVIMVAHPVVSSTNLDPATIVQRQLDAYNARDIDGLVAIYADDAGLYEHPDKLLATGTAALRERFAARFQEPNLHAALLHRIVAGESSSTMSASPAPSPRARARSNWS